MEQIELMPARDVYRFTPGFFKGKRTGSIYYLTAQGYGIIVHAKGLAYSEGYRNGMRVSMDPKLFTPVRNDILAFVIGD